MVSEVQPMYKKALPTGVLPLITSPSDAMLVLKEVWNKHRFDYSEQVYALYLNGSHHAHAWSLIAEGSVNHCQVYTQKVLTLGLITNSIGFVLAHNHPSGSRMISEPDKSFTTKIVQAAKLVGLSFLDHLVFSSLDEEAVSIRGTFPYLFNH
ncbi:MAG: JAB domain-containing protein [Waterburya sp.]